MTQTYSEKLILSASHSSRDYDLPTGTMDRCSTSDQYISGNLGRLTAGYIVTKFLHTPKIGFSIRDAFTE